MIGKLGLMLMSGNNFFHLYFSGAQGEYAGLRSIMAYLHAIEETQRKVLQPHCLCIKGKSRLHDQGVHLGCALNG